MPSIMSARQSATRERRRLNTEVRWIDRTDPCRELSKGHATVQVSQKQQPSHCFCTSCTIGAISPSTSDLPPYRKDVLTRLRRPFPQATDSHLPLAPYLPISDRLQGADRWLPTAVTADSLSAIPPHPSRQPPSRSDMTWPQNAPPGVPPRIRASTIPLASASSDLRLEQRRSPR